MPLRKIGLLVLFFFISLSAFSLDTNSVSLTEFSRLYGLDLTYNLALGYCELSSGGDEGRLFMSMPYFTFDGSIYYLQERPRINEKGDTVISKNTAALIKKTMDLKPVSGKKLETVLTNVRASTNTVKTEQVVFIASNKISSTSSSSRASSSVSVQKDDQSSKSNYNKPQDGPFTPVTAIIIDPGHGGKDPGGLGVNGIKEKEIVLSIAQNLAVLLKKEPGVKVFLCRRDDRYVSLKERTDLASGLIRAGYNPVFISIHGNISLNRNVSGIEVYELSDKASDEEAMSVETMENAGFSKTDVDKTDAVYSILNDLMKDGIRRQSDKLARDIAASISEASGAEVRGIKKANFYVLKYNSMPSILAEVGFMSNPEEAKKMIDGDYQGKLAQGLYQGITSFLSQYNKSRGFTQ